MARAIALRVVEAQALAYRRLWRGSVFTTIVNPILYLAAMGLGLASLVDGGASTAAAADLPGDGYLEFIAPGLLAAAAMQTAANEATFPVMAGFKWERTYEAVLAAPPSARDLARGTIAWVCVRVLMSAAIFTIVLVLFGAAESPLVVLAIPAAVLTGAAFAAPLAAVTTSLKNEYGLTNILRFGVVPLFLFSGTFFPVEQLPDWLEPVAWVVPLWHGVELCRGLSLGELDGLAAVGHVAYLAVWVAVGTALAAWRFEKRLIV